MMFIRRFVYFVIVVITLTAVMTALANASCANMQRLAQEHSNDMAVRRSMDHRGFERRARLGARAENVAIASSKAQVLQRWRASPPHAANMILPGCHGIANSGRYWTMEIGE